MSLHYLRRWTSPAIFTNESDDAETCKLIEEPHGDPRLAASYQMRRHPEEHTASLASPLPLMASLKLGSSTHALDEALATFHNDLPSDLMHVDGLHAPKLLDSTGSANRDRTVQSRLDPNSTCPSLSRHGLFILACTHVILASGQVFGWTALRSVLIASDLFHEHDRDAQLVLMHSVGTAGEY